MATWFKEVTMNTIIWCTDLFVEENSWTEEQLANIKNDNGYKLLLANHITDVCSHLVPNTGYVYLKSNYIPETS